YNAVSVHVASPVGGEQIGPRGGRAGKIAAVHGRRVVVVAVTTEIDGDDESMGVVRVARAVSDIRRGRGVTGGYTRAAERVPNKGLMLTEAALFEVSEPPEAVQRGCRRLEDPRSCAEQACVVGAGEHDDSLDRGAHSP